MSVPAVFKPFNKYLVQARKLDKIHPVAAYYCRLQFVKKAFAALNGKKDEETSQILGDLMDTMEKAKPSLPEKEERQEMILSLAMNVFGQADTEDRAGNANKATAIKFRMSSLLIEVSLNLGDLSEEVKEKLRYARWKTVDIMKALKEGRKPTPGPPGGLEEEKEVLGEGGENSDKKQMEISNDDDVSSYHRRGEVEATPISTTDPTPVQAEVVVPTTDESVTPATAEAYAPQYSQPFVAPPADAPPADAQPVDEIANIMRGLEQPVVPIKPEKKSEPMSTRHSTGASGGRTGDGLYVRPRKVEDAIAAEIEAEKMVGHAGSALRFHDIDTAIEKLVKALSVLIPYAKETNLQ